MELAKFTALCTKLGRADRDAADRWKDIKYISTIGQSGPVGGDIQRLIKADAFTFVNNEEFGTGFIFFENEQSELNIVNRDKCITFLGLENVVAVSFVAKDGMVDIVDVLNDINGTTLDLPVKITLPTITLSFTRGLDIAIPIKFNRLDITTDNYDLEYFDSNGNSVDPTTGTFTIGTYKLKVTCKNGYSGSAECYFEIT